MRIPPQLHSPVTGSGMLEDMVTVDVDRLVENNIIQEFEWVLRH